MICEASAEVVPYALATELVVATTELVVATTELVVDATELVASVD